MICIAALIVLAILSLVSAKYRPYAKEALNCVARRLTLRPCTVRFDQKVKAKITAKLLKRNAKLARFTHKHFESISWVFTIILIVSLVLAVNGLANLWLYGTCDPDGGNCPFAATEPEKCTALEWTCEPCLCGEEEIGCESPTYQACGGDCSCVQEMCG